MAQKDGIDLWNAISEHRQASAAKESAQQLARMADVQERGIRIQAEAAKAQTNARNREARAAEIQASIEQSRYNREISLRNAKSKLSQFFSALDFRNVEIEKLVGADLHELVQMVENFSSEKSQLLEQLSYENDITQSQRVREMLASIDSNIRVANSSRTFQGASKLVLAINECKGVEAKIQELKDEISGLAKAMAKIAIEVIGSKEASTQDLGFKVEDAFKSFRLESDKSLSSLFRMKLIALVLGYPLLLAALVPLFTLGFWYGLPLIAVSLFSINYLTSRAEDGIHQKKFKIKEMSDLMSRYAVIKRATPIKVSNLQSLTQEFVQKAESLSEHLASVTTKHGLTDALVSQIMDSADGWRFVKDRS